jgi:hypothetical protein
VISLQRVQVKRHASGRRQNATHSGSGRLHFIPGRALDG